jgi:hypothetical protein
VTAVVVDDLELVEVEVQHGALLKSKIRWRDTLARLGGDEFGVLLESCTMDEALRTAETLREVINEFKFVWDDRTFRLTASVGAVPISTSTDDVAALLQAADSACGAAKDAGRNRVYSYQENDIDLMKRRKEMQWAARISNALEENRFELFRQRILPLQPGLDVVTEESDPPYMAPGPARWLDSPRRSPLGIDGKPLLLRPCRSRDRPGHIAGRPPLYMYMPCHRSMSQRDGAWQIPTVLMGNLHPRQELWLAEYAVTPIGCNHFPRDESGSLCFSRLEAEGEPLRPSEVRWVTDRFGRTSQHAAP